MAILLEGALTELSKAILVEQPSYRRNDLIVDPNIT